MARLLLVRHGQASFGSDDYDALSQRGVAQAVELGQCWAARGFRPDLLVTGSLHRQMGTAAALRSGARWTTAIELDAGWDEFDHLGLVAAQTGQQDADMRDSRVFQTLLEAGMRAWPDNSRSVETFEAFRSRTQAALDRALGGLDKGATAVVITSAGVIGWLATALLDGGMEQWIRLNRVCVNTGVTTVVRGRSGTTLVGFNDHAHLASDHVTYR